MLNLLFCKQNFEIFKDNDLADMKEKKMYENIPT